MCSPAGSRSHSRSLSRSCRGRGPTKLISPLRTLTNWGSSSRLERRRNRPRRVTRGSWRILNKTPPADSLDDSRSASRRSAPPTMVRNFNIRNGCPLCPRRTWRNTRGRGNPAGLTQQSPAATAPTRSGRRGPPSGRWHACPRVPDNPPFAPSLGLRTATRSPGSGLFVQLDEPCHSQRRH